MSYTNVELVKHYLELSFPIQTRVFDQTVVLENDDYVTFFGGSIDESSLKVKSLRNNDLIKMNLTLDSSTVSLSSTPLVIGSVVVASDSSLGTIYIENEDYVIDYSYSKLIIKSNGTLSIGMTVTVWYLEYYIYSSGDYQVDSSKGAVKRKANGNITTGERVYLDYTPVYTSYTDEILNNAVIEANGLIEQAVDPKKQFGADPVLQSTATYRALEIICRASASRELSSSKSDDRTALAWMKLADHYAQRSEHLLGSFRPPFENLSTPTHS
ncbi:MAG: hypothetical protein ACE5D6_03255 [Candidatus Zixiibacteriota bacterium]